MPAHLIGLELDEIKEFIGPSEPAYRSRQLYRALYHQRVVSIDEITTFGAPLRRELAAATTVGLPSTEQRFESADGTRRYLLRLADHLTVEAVLMPEDGRDTLCISTQVGCPVDCKFCLTALMGLERNLTAGEIVGQVFELVRDNGLDPAAGRLNIVLMGQGEPLLNLPNVLKATRLLTDPEGFGLSEKRITLSTSGIIPKIVELGQA
ncbi:MAG: radical SAM protein, partial [bacterium]|nr:radical SAM protein [bacterium]